ncbi:respiratory burst oxidase homolog protein A-like [Gastrolobium bilobum]|uniref:respiratory burst oxidase homolog protein A-like n=1 Tax=Gastrolobium bilobum TaxID=150636 RepID=UPI002AB10F62|nr:respiratory burst oxidase homolog protein A-like [Gastrolobium bilobum]
MDGLVKFQTADHDRSLIALFKSSPSSSSLSSSSSSCSSSSSWTNEKVSHEGEQSHVAENEAIQGMGFINGIVGHSGIMEWKDVEKRFDQVAWTGNGPEPVVTWSEFGFCIGMLSSPEFANELLRALRGHRDWKFNITKTELHKFWFRMKDDSINSRMRIFFDMCNRNMDGRITEMDIKQTILLTASTNKLSVTHEEAEDYAALFMESLDDKNKGYIEISQMESLFKASLTKPASSTRGTHDVHDSDLCEEQEPMSRAEVLFRTYWRRAWIVLVWLLACFVLFAWKFIQYRHRSGYEIMGYCLPTAKGAAETLKLNMALVLLPVCRNTITWLRKNHHVNSVIPFNDNINFHKLIAGGIVVGVILHGGTHLACDFPRISESDRSIFRQTIAAGFGYHQPTYMEILTTTEVATGIGMVVLMAIAFSLATKWPRRRSTVLPVSLRRVTGYNTFWYSHHLFVLVYALLIVHSMFLFLTDKLMEKTTWMYIAFPVLLYTGERVFRAIRSGSYEVDILKASLYPGKVLYLKMQKPEGFKYQSGMYIFLQCPQISYFEWHPFSLTSGPQDDYLSVHIRTLGDWSYQLYALFQEAVISGLQGCPKLYIDGPYGSASQDHVKYDILVLIGLGIGATPFISILKDVTKGVQTAQSDHSGLRECSLTKGPLKAYLYWITREQNSFDWFRDVMKEISNSTKKQSVVEMHNFLTSVYPEGDVRSALLSVIQALHHAKNGIDMVSRTPIHTHFARPNWFNIFSRLARKHGGAKIGVFYCGPSNLARELKKLCTKFSTKTTTRFVFHKENY